MGAGTLFLILAVAVAALVVLIYNRLITLRNRFLNGFSQIEVQLQRRYELIPNLVETASAYMKHEAETLTAVTLTLVIPRSSVVPMLPKRLTMPVPSVRWQQLKGLWILL